MKMVNKVNFTDEQIEKLAMKFKILSETSRLKILRSLFYKKLSVSEIMKETNLLQANVSKQLKILQTNGIVECQADRTRRIYSVIDNTIVQICELICKSNQADK